MSKKTTTTTTTVTVVEENVKTAPLETIVSLIIDESSSMSSARDQVISGVNEYIASLKSKDSAENRYLITLTKFADTSNVVYRHRPIYEWTPLTMETYHPNGMTALNDAIGDTVKANEEYTKGRSEVAVLVVIMTDGGENNSKSYSTDAIKEMIISKEKSSEWNFVYLGANQDSFSVASTYGVRGANIANFSNSNTSNVFRNISGSMDRYSKTRSKGAGATVMYAMCMDSVGLLNEDDAKKYSNPDHSKATEPDPVVPVDNQ